MRYLALLCLLSALAGCEYGWNRPTILRIPARVMRCASLSFDASHAYCHKNGQPPITVPWELISGVEVR